MTLRIRKIPKIGKKIIIAMLVVSLIPLGFIGIHNIDYTYNQLSMTKEEQLKTIAIDLATYADSLLSNAKKRIEELAKSPLTVRTALNASEWNESLLWNSYEGGVWDLEENITQTKPISEWNVTNDLDPSFSYYINDLAISNGFSEIFVTDERGFVYASSESIPGDFYQEGESWWNSTRQSSIGTFIEFGYDESTKQFLRRFWS